MIPLSVGQSAERTRTFCHDDVAFYVQLTKDENPLHRGVVPGALIGATTLAGDSFTGVTEALIALPLLGAGAGTASLLVARRASPKLGAGDQSESVK